MSDWCFEEESGEKMRIIEVLLRILRLLGDISSALHGTRTAEGGLEGDSGVDPKIKKCQRSTEDMMRE